LMSLTSMSMADAPRASREQVAVRMVDQRMFVCF
jgi:hypothetical protein